MRCGLVEKPNGAFAGLVCVDTSRGRLYRIKEVYEVTMLVETIYRSAVFEPFDTILLMNF